MTVTTVTTVTSESTVTTVEWLWHRFLWLWNLFLFQWLCCASCGNSWECDDGDDWDKDKAKFATETSANARKDRREFRVPNWKTLFEEIWCRTSTVESSGWREGFTVIPSTFLNAQMAPRMDIITPITLKSTLREKHKWFYIIQTINNVLTSRAMASLP